MSRNPSTIRNTGKVARIGRLPWIARIDDTTDRITPSFPSSSSGIGLPPTNRVTMQPRSGSKATTSGPTPASAATRPASTSAARSIPSSSVSVPASRRTKVSPSTSTR